MMRFRRVQTGYSSDGRSTIISDESLTEAPLPGFGGIIRMWGADQPHVYPSDAERGAPEAIFPPPGGSRFVVFSLSPGDVASHDKPTDSAPGLDAIMAESGGDGWHTTNTTDLGVVLEGEVVLQLEDGEVVLHPGDCIVQHGTRHRWLNRSNKAAIMVFFTAGATRT
jgi:quercetin dioxygenase-like cupin family protein